jgi:uncharacterized protein (UPF0248 family)
MIPIQELLNRIHWDAEFARGEFVIGYYDRVEDRIIEVPLRELYFDPGDHFSFQLLDEEGETHTIPFHRIKAVYKDGRLIWHREH